MTVPQYVKNAQNNYSARIDIVQLRFLKGTKEGIKLVSNDMSMSMYYNYNYYIK